ncbi:Protein of unknown function [Pyronema omphalodes CBS 100304]|uniref:Uncharacterized protein n=1 Tax=Pyronema omphalodes (strain CBS 100304) TaxID=1076935 RepID=U4LEM0_PYROM|nr:Protein of unknown function [Pyronema omphalodes CBS 100304]
MSQFAHNRGAGVLIDFGTVYIPLELSSRYSHATTRGNVPDGINRGVKSAWCKFSDTPWRTLRQAKIKQGVSKQSGPS